MLRVRRALAAGLAIAVALVLTALVAQELQVPSGVNVNSGGLSPSAIYRPPEILSRVEGHIATLKAESLEQSLANLGEWELWYYPGAVINELGSVTLPLEATEGAGTFERILSNRRFLKVYQELGALEPARAAALLNACLPVWVDQYSAKYARYLERTRRLVLPPSVPREAGSMEVVGWGGGTDSDGLPNLELMRWRLLAVILIAGNLRLQGTALSMQQIAEYARAQRDYLYQAEDLVEGYRAVTLTTKSLYNRQILAEALIHTSTVPGEGLATLNKGFAVKFLPRFEALRTPYDRLLFGPVDYSKGLLAVERVQDISDAEFDNVLVATLRQ